MAEEVTDHSAVLATKEQRRAQRFPMAYPVAVKSAVPPEEKGVSVTKDISATGVYFELNSSVEIGSVIKFDLTLANATVGGKPLLLHCSGKVQRIDQNIQATARVGLGISVESWD